MNIPTEAIEAAAEAMNSTVPNSGGVLWEHDEVIDDRTGMTQPRPVTLKDAARVALTAATPVIREAIAQEVEAEKDVTSHLRGLEALDAAARIVRGGAV